MKSSAKQFYLLEKIKKAETTESLANQKRLLGRTVGRLVAKLARRQ